jgi:hypothetical protein
MKRLVHSPQGYLRQMQMSKTSVWIFVEGKTDRYFYSKLADATAQELGKSQSVEVVSADELAADGGGKSVLVKFFEFLKASRNLVSHLAGKQTRSVFFLDKDVDDLLKKRKLSPHVIYTDFYSMENYLFKHGDIADACSVTLSLPIQEARRIIGDAKSWRNKCANLWQDWVSLCLYASKSGIGIANFKSPSRVNVGFYGSVDKVLLSTMESVCLAGVTPIGDAQQLLADCQQKVLQYYSTNRYDRVFNGKWYAHFLEDHFSKLVPSVSCQGLSKKVLLHLAQSLKFEGLWARRLRSKLAPHLMT